MRSSLRLRFGFAGAGAGASDSILLRAIITSSSDTSRIAVTSQSTKPDICTAWSGWDMRPVPSVFTIHFPFLFLSHTSLSVGVVGKGSKSPLFPFLTSKHKRHSLFVSVSKYAVNCATSYWSLSFSSCAIKLVRVICPYKLIFHRLPPSAFDYVVFDRQANQK